jgi:hypothetical protein
VFRAILTRLLATLLIAESMFGALRVAGLVPRLAGYDDVAIVLILARGLLGPLQFASGWLLATRRPQGFALAPWALALGAAITVFDVGLGLAPTAVYPWWRWQVTLAYAAYALGAVALLRSARPL